MFLWLQEAFQSDFSPFRVFGFVTFRTLGALLTALLFTIFLYPRFIRSLQSRQIGESIRDDGPERHQQKQGTPTMGGLLILIAVLLSVLLWADLENPFVLCTTTLFVAFGFVGFFDDYAKLAGNKKGLPGKLRLIIEFAVTGCVLALFLEHSAGPNTTTLYIPFVSNADYSLNLNNWVYGFFASVIIVGTANAVNLTDGLDGLAIGPTIVSSGTFLILAYATSSGLILCTNWDEGLNSCSQFKSLGEYLMIPHVGGVEELTVFAAALMGAGVGFLWYNTFPASIFMGDVGALSVGAALGTLAVLTKNELLSAIIHGLFLLEAVSVIVQTTSYKLTGKRVFRMAPIHHHFEMKGWAEPKIIVRFWVISILLALVALASLKLR
ncbi:MAG: phospho-N-acetylmuramoyl-pentapeptide-transferase [Myxococcales bacterium]|nr:phospho-N-acetylmuramoyl-pentapeptide-transferase [Myxococcales bacterium]